MNSQEYYLNIRPGDGYPQTVKVSQGDVGRPLLFHLMDGVNPLSIPAGATITIHGTKPSGLGFTETCTVSGSSAAISTTLAITQEYGLFPAELVVSANNDIIATANFSLYVERNPHPDGTTDGTKEELDDLYTEVANLKEDIGDLDDLETEDKSNLVAAINEAAQGGGGGGGSVSPYTSNPAALGTASPGSVNKYSRGDHVHPLPTASAIGAISAPSSPATGAFLVWDGSAWVAQTLSTWQGGSY